MVIQVLSFDDNLLGNGAFFACCHEVIYATGTALHVVFEYVVAQAIGDIEMVDEGPSHVVHFHVDFAVEVFKVDGHVTVVGVGHHAEGP